MLLTLPLLKRTANPMAVWRAKELGIRNFSVLVSHVTVPPAMVAILDSPDNRVQGCLAAGHVCTIVVSPLEVPGGNIGTLAIHGTLNDLALMGAAPRYLSAGFVLEKGLRLDLLERIVPGMAQAARAAGVPLITGDTKVVERTKADGLFIDTTGIGLLAPGFRPGPTRAQAGDAILVSGPIGRHGIAITAEP